MSSDWFRQVSCDKLLRSHFLNQLGTFQLVVRKTLMEASVTHKSSSLYLTIVAFIKGLAQFSSCVLQPGKFTETFLQEQLLAGAMFLT